MPRETWTAPATLPLSATSGVSRTSTMSVLSLAIISRAWAGVIRGTVAFAASNICLTLVVMTLFLFLIEVLADAHSGGHTESRTSAEALGGPAPADCRRNWSPHARHYRFQRGKRSGAI